MDSYDYVEVIWDQTGVYWGYVWVHMIIKEYVDINGLILRFYK